MKNIFFLGFIVAAIFLAGAKDSYAAREGDLRCAITSAVASDPDYSNYRELTTYVAERVGRKAIFISGLSYGKVDDLFMSRQADVGFLCNTHFARRKDVVKFEPVAAPVIEGYGGRPKFRIYLIVNKDSGLNSLDDLRGKSVDLADPLSTTAVFAARLLQERGATVRSFFGKTIYSGSHDMTVELVANRMVDAGIIDGHIWDYHDKVLNTYSAKTRVIYRSGYFTTPPVVVSRTVDKDLKKRIKNVLLAMHEDPEGQKILRKLRIERFVNIRERDYQDVLRMYNQVKDRL